MRSNIEKAVKIELIKEIKKHERDLEVLPSKDLALIGIELEKGKIGCVKNFLEKNGYLNQKLKIKSSKQENKIYKLKEILSTKETELKKQNYDEAVLKEKISKIYETYKKKPHFIIEQDKYEDLDRLIRRIKINTKICKKSESNANDIKNNIFSILLEQLRHKVDIGILIPALKKLVNTKDELRYSKVVDNTYYYELLKMIK